MKLFRIVIGTAAVLTLAASCLEDKDSYRAGFIFRMPTTVMTGVYANNEVDSVSFLSYGAWAMSRDAAYSGNGWFTINTTQGYGNTLYSLPVRFTQNDTGNGRGVQLNFYDTDHPGEASATILFWQYATRGDGTLGSAPDVKAIHGSDGSEFTFAYDNQHRPTELTMNDGISSVSRRISLTWNDYDSLLTVSEGSKVMTSSYARDYQPQCLLGQGDTIRYVSQYNNYGMPVAASYAFNLEHRGLNGNGTYYAIRHGGQSLSPDSLHCPDSLRIATVSSEGTRIERYGMKYSSTDNRCQSVDANQLVFGASRCDIYQLLSLFRYTRATSVVSELSTTNENERISVSTTLNADKSIATLTTQQTGQKTTYTFEY